MWKPLAGMVATALVAAAPALAQAPGETIDVELHNRSQTRKVFVNTEASGLVGPALFLQPLEAGSNMRERFELPRSADAGTLTVAMRVYGMDMRIEDECIYTLTFARPLEGNTTDRMQAGSRTLCSGDLFVLPGGDRVLATVFITP